MSLDYVFGSIERITVTTSGASFLLDVDPAWHAAPEDPVPDILGWEVDWVEG